MDNQNRNHGQTNERLVELLQSIDRPGDYCVGGKLYVPMPRVTINGVGDLSFPVPKAQIDALIDVAEQAPYGKGTKTLTDTSVRDCRQIDSDQVRLSGRKWRDTFEDIIHLVSEGLGLDQDQIGAKLYKLLVYREGGFFAAHRDTEKVPGMIATLSLSMPTPGEGGELIISHGGKETIYNMGAQEPSEISFAAFYADCLHEAKPVTKGHRVSLVYNLFIRSGKQWTGAPDYTELTEKVEASLADWRIRGSTDKLIWLLDHSYSEDGLSFDALKGVDAAVAQVLGKAADRTDCSMYAAILHIRETGDPEIDDYGYDWDDEPIVGSSIAELYEREENLENWVARDGSKPPFGDLALAKGEVLQSDMLEDMDPDDELLEDYQGNYGPTLDLIYRFAALVVWPKAKTLEILAGGGIRHAVSWAATQLNLVSESEMHLLLSRLSAMWPESRTYYQDHNLPEMIRLLSATGSADLATDFLPRIVLDHYDGDENPFLADLMLVVGPKAAKDFLLKLIEQHMLERPNQILSLLFKTSENLDEEELDWRDTEREVVRSALSAFPAVMEEISKLRDARKAYVMSGRKTEYISQESVEERSLNSVAIYNLFALALSTDYIQESVNVATRIADFPEVVSPDRMLPDALEELNKIGQTGGTHAYRLLWQQSADSLLTRSSVPPNEPVDWVVNADLQPTSELASELRDFCENPKARSKRFKVNRNRRKYLRQLINDLGLDIDYLTERKGSPYKLVCTKNRAGHKRRLNEYSSDLDYFDLLIKLVPRDETGNAEAERVQRIKAAKASFR